MGCDYSSGDNQINIEENGELESERVEKGVSKAVKCKRDEPASVGGRKKNHGVKLPSLRSMVNLAKQGFDISRRVISNGGFVRCVHVQHTKRAVKERT